MPIGDLLELIVCTECKTRVEYHDDRDGYMSCECWIHSTADDPTPDKWIEIEDRKVNECGGCRANIPERSVFRCADCGLPFHQTCLDQHCKHGNQKQELRSENLFLKAQLTALRAVIVERDALLLRGEEAERKLCAATRATDIATIYSGNIGHSRKCRQIQESHGLYQCFCRYEELLAALLEVNSSSPCRHAAEADAMREEGKRLDGVVGWAIETCGVWFHKGSQITQKEWREELVRRRARGEG
jgi:uncharacterized protein YbaR (Trm112 family)